MGRAVVWLISGLALSILLVLFIGAIFYSDLILDLPAIEGVQNWYSLTQDQFPAPVQVFDRSGEKIVATLLHPEAVDRQWYQVDSARSPSIPETMINAVLSVQDETFWSHTGFDTKKMIGGIFDSLIGADENEIYRSIPQRLIYMTVMPAEDFSQPQIFRYLRSAILAQNLVESYSKGQILEWYLNSTNFGYLTPGVDAASLVYFDQHASYLSLAESAVLAALLEQPGLDPYADFAHLKELQGGILARMANLDFISNGEFDAALSEVLNLAKLPAPQENGLAGFAEGRIIDALGPVMFQRQGIEIYTSIDHDVQSEVTCATNFHQDRLSGLYPSQSTESSQVEECLTATLLPPLRPGDLGVDHRIDESALVAIDPRSGEILALFGEVGSERSTETIAYPLLYLTAFTRGYSPGSMVLDLPALTEEKDNAIEEQEPGEGPLLMRNALVGSYQYAAERTLDLVGWEAFFQVVQQLGLHPGAKDEQTNESRIEDMLSASLLDLAYAYSTFANHGTMIGAPTNTSDRINTLSPILIRSIKDSSGVELYGVNQTSQSILSPPLAYLLVDVLGDAAARWPLYGRPNIFDLNRPTGVMTQREENIIYESWTIGFTPSLVVGAWMGNSGGGEMYRVNSENGAASLWRAVMEYVLSDQPSEGWIMPSEILQVEVCDPSGHLATTYCPYLVQELFLPGTEPIQYDKFYVPVEINRETGKLATILTPLDLIEERVFFIPPPEASWWAEFQGIEQPPLEYEPVIAAEDLNPKVSIEYPSMFSYINGRVRVRGSAVSEGFSYYRLQYGEGLNPSYWILIGENNYEAEERGLLTIWEIEDLEGLYTLQLLVVDRDGRLKSDFIHVTVDNELPIVELDRVPEEIVLSYGEGAEMLLITQVSDNVSIEMVEFVVNNRVIGEVESEPYIWTISMEKAGQYEILARAHDLAGNVGESEVQTVRIVVVE